MDNNVRVKPFASKTNTKNTMYLPETNKISFENATLLEKAYWKRNENNNLRNGEHVMITYRFVKCKKCGTNILNNHKIKRFHCVSHLIKDGKIDKAVYHVYFVVTNEKFQYYR